MFTGLIEEIGQITRIDPIAGGKKIRVLASKILDDIKVDDSIAINGVCLTATKIEQDGFWADAVGETLNKTTLVNMRVGAQVNVERALKLSDRLGGHLVQGHVNGIATITQINKLGENYFLEINIPRELTKYTIDEGSISIDGISLTIAKLNDTKVGVSVIPHTWAASNLKDKKVGDLVNIETDVLAKYIEKLLMNKSGNGTGKFTDEWFKNLGY